MLGVDELGRMGHPHYGVAAYPVVKRGHHHRGHDLMGHLGDVEACVAAGERDVAASGRSRAEAHAAAFDNADHEDLRVADRLIAVKD